MHTLTEKVDFIESIFGKCDLSRDGLNASVRCPICDHPETKKKLVIRTDNDKVHCWVCGFAARSLLSLLKRFSSTSKIEIYKKKFRPDLLLHNMRAEEDIKAQEKLKVPADFKLLALSSSRDPDVIRSIKYLKSRGLSESDLWRYKFGISSSPNCTGRIIMPSFDREGQLNYYTARATDPAIRLKYWNPYVKRTEIIFNELNVEWNQRLVLCEGPFDAVKCGDNVVPLLGSDLDENYLLFEKIIENNTPIALALDRDMIETKTLKILSLLSTYTIDVIVVDVGDYADPGNMTRSQFQEALAKAKHLEWKDITMSKLKKISKLSLRL